MSTNGESGAISLADPLHLGVRSRAGPQRWLIVHKKSSERSSSRTRSDKPSVATLKADVMVVAVQMS